MPDLTIDNTTLALLGILACLLLYSRFSRPTPLVHPLLLGKQSEVSAVRRKGETGVYRCFATGQGTPLQVRPANTVKTVRDVLPSLGSSSDKQAKQRQILDVVLTDESLAHLVHLLPLGFASLFPSLLSSSSSPSLPDTRPILVLLPSSFSTALPLLLLSLASTASNPLIVLSSPLHLSSALTATSHPAPALVIVHASLVEDVMEQVNEDRGEACGVLVVGDPEREKEGAVKGGRAGGLTVEWWEDVWDAAERAEEDGKGKHVERQYGDVHSWFYTSTIGEGNKADIVQLTQMNFTAGLAGLLSLFPADKRPLASDTVASSIPLTTPLGMTIALASIWTGANFRMFGNAVPTWEIFTDAPTCHANLMAMMEDPAKPKPTVLFTDTPHLEALCATLHDSLLSHPIASLLARHKLTALRDGHLTRDTYLDKWVWAGLRKGAMGGLAHSLRSVVVVGAAPLESTLPLAQLLLSLLISRLHPSPLSTGPLLVSHYYDLQSSGIAADHLTQRGVFARGAGEGRRSHSGAPGSNVEVMLRGPGVEAFGDEKSEQQRAVRGRIWVRGPAVGEVLGRAGQDGWVECAEEAEVRTNGTFVVL